ncbi:hypothetical protein CYMTET_5448 [Cymbomonas tetramitiformis]|uniref:Uncharacterized protein n=1 Tax=Cymbomonas tetramitiformis TaxID=36881 RepID=A0AAE0GZG3_9CHLO|nr:hypothetical protein CYMTET_5448 [Cymbomonas tetramitiformis]
MYDGRHLMQTDSPATASDNSVVLNVTVNFANTTRDTMIRFIVDLYYYPERIFDDNFTESYGTPTPVYYELDEVLIANVTIAPTAPFDQAVPSIFYGLTASGAQPPPPALASDVVESTGFYGVPVQAASPTFEERRRDAETRDDASSQSNMYGITIAPRPTTLSDRAQRTANAPQSHPLFMLYGLRTGLGFARTRLYGATSTLRVLGSCDDASMVRIADYLREYHAEQSLVSALHDVVHASSVRVTARIVQNSFYGLPCIASVRIAYNATQLSDDPISNDEVVDPWSGDECLMFGPVLVPECAASPPPSDPTSSPPTPRTVFHDPPPAPTLDTFYGIDTRATRRLHLVAHLIIDEACDDALMGRYERELQRRHGHLRNLSVSVAVIDAVFYGADIGCTLRGEVIHDAELSETSADGDPNIIAFEETDPCALFGPILIPSCSTPAAPKQHPPPPNTTPPPVAIPPTSSLVIANTALYGLSDELYGVRVVGPTITSDTGEGLQAIAGGVLSSVRAESASVIDLYGFYGVFTPKHVPPRALPPTQVDLSTPSSQRSERAARATPVESVLFYGFYGLRSQIEERQSDPKTAVAQPIAPPRKDISIAFDDRAGSEDTLYGFCEEDRYAVRLSLLGNKLIIT